MTVNIISRHSKTIHKLVEEQMKKEVKELGFDPWGDTAQEEFECRVTDLEKHALKNPEMAIIESPSYPTKCKDFLACSNISKGKMGLP